MIVNIYQRCGEEKIIDGCQQIKFNSSYLKDLTKIHIIEGCRRGYWRWSLPWNPTEATLIEKIIQNYQLSIIRRACVLRVLGLLLEDGAPTCAQWWGGGDFLRLPVFLRKRPKRKKEKSKNRSQGAKWTVSRRATYRTHTWYLSFFLHWQNFRRIKFTPKFTQ